ncbi:hypothetical protein ACF08N_38015 [Streptomyces sp. NPDC015127]|uniref:hypothetical protein n=1 Tax=Streptomyces sp. NPDC015127 TaxID=3364939 RepID=UPI003700FCA7
MYVYAVTGLAAGNSFGEAAQKLNPGISQLVQTYDTMDGCGASMGPTSTKAIHFPTDAAMSDKYHWMPGDPEYGAELRGNITQVCLNWSS